MHRELITFEVGGQVFGIDIMAIREIRAWSPTTRLPRVPHYVSGVVNLRGTVLPVIDLAARLGWESTEPTSSPCRAISFNRPPPPPTTASSPFSKALPPSKIAWSWCWRLARWAMGRSLAKLHEQHAAPGG
jgi:hypothetical protein